MESEKVAVVLSGGGAVGAFQSGVLQSMEDAGERIDAIYGTSAGALNAAGYSILKAKGLISVWESIDSRSDVFRTNKWAFLPFKKYNSGLYYHSPLERLVNRIFSLGKPKIPSCVTRVSLTTGKLEYVYSTSEDFKNAVISSACIPVYANPHHRCIDGGTRENTPLSRPISDGYKNIKVILCSNPLEPVRELRNVNSWWEIAARAFQIVLNEHFLEDIKTCQALNSHPGYQKVNVSVCCPRGLSMGTLSFSAKKIEEAIVKGRDSSFIPMAEFVAQQKKIEKVILK